MGLISDHVFQRATSSWLQPLSLMLRPPPPPPRHLPDLPVSGISASNSRRRRKKTLSSWALSSPSWLPVQGSCRPSCRSSLLLSPAHAQHRKAMDPALATVEALVYLQPLVPLFS